MALPSMQSTLLRYQQEIMIAMRAALRHAEGMSSAPGRAETPGFYGQMRYHLGWVDADFAPLTTNPGKLLRPTLLLLAYEAAGANGLTAPGNAASDKSDYLARALPAAAALELTHNFTLIHDDIEDSDAERRHRATLWKLWAFPRPSIQAMACSRSPA